MSTIITTRHERRVEADPSGMTVTDTTDGQSIMVALTRAQAGELAAALVPERDFSGVDWRAMFVSAAGERDAAVARAEKAAQLIPAYAMLDIWMAIGRDSIHFDDWYDEHGYADAWAELTAAVREGRGDLDAARENAEHYQAMFDATERQRDEWKSRAEAAEARYGSERLRWERARDHHADESRKWGEKRRWYEARIAELEAAEARTAPAVTRDDVKGVIDHWIEQGGNHEALLDDLWRWVSGDDPAVFVVRESDVAAVEVKRASDGWYADGAWIASADDTAEWVRDRAAEMVVYAARSEAVARAIEQDAATDPVLDKARELYRAATPDARWETVADEYRRIARHVLGQEAGQ